MHLPITLYYRVSAGNLALHQVIVLHSEQSTVCCIALQNAAHLIYAFPCVSCCLLSVLGLIVGIIIRYGLDAKKHLFVMDCWHNISDSSESEPPTSVVIHYNNTQYFEYTNGRKVDDKYVGQPQFEDKVVVGHSCWPFLQYFFA